MHSNPHPRIHSGRKSQKKTLGIWESPQLIVKTCLALEGLLGTHEGVQTACVQGVVDALHGLHSKGSKEPITALREMHVHLSQSVIRDMISKLKT